MITSKLGKMLIGANLINDEQLNKALSTQQKEGGKLGSVLVKLGYISEDKLLNF